MLSRCDHSNLADCVHNPSSHCDHKDHPDDPCDHILSSFRRLQPAEQKMILDRLMDELHSTGFECTYCGRRTRDPVWLANLPLCRSCHSWIFSVEEKTKLVYGVRR